MKGTEKPFALLKFPPPPLPSHPLTNGLSPELADRVITSMGRLVVLSRWHPTAVQVACDWLEAFVARFEAGGGAL